MLNKFISFIYKLIGYEGNITYYPILFSGDPERELWACECLKTKAVGIGLTKKEAFNGMIFNRKHFRKSKIKLKEFSMRTIPMNKEAEFRV